MPSLYISVLLPHTHDMDGNGLNDIFITGNYTSIEHYNSINIKEYSELKSDGMNAGLKYYKNNLFIVGVTNAYINRGLFIHGIR